MAGYTVDRSPITPLDVTVVREGDDVAVGHPFGSFPAGPNRPISGLVNGTRGRWSVLQTSCDRAIDLFQDVTTETGFTVTFRV